MRFLSELPSLVSINFTSYYWVFSVGELLEEIFFSYPEINLFSRHYHTQFQPILKYFTFNIDQQPSYVPTKLNH